MSGGTLKIANSYLQVRGPYHYFFELLHDDNVKYRLFREQALNEDKLFLVKVDLIKIFLLLLGEDVHTKLIRHNPIFIIIIINIIIIPKF